MLSRARYAVRQGAALANRTSGGQRRWNFTVPAIIQPAAKEFGEVKVYLDGDTFAWLVMDRPGKSTNTLNNTFLRSVESATAYLEEQFKLNRFRVVILTSAKSTFCVGADVFEVYPITDVSKAKEVVWEGRRVLQRLRSIPVPFVAAINGTALGGGLEIALACDYRICANSDEKVKLGLPEIQLGVLPGLGGTVRLPKLAGLDGALGNILAGKQLVPSRARRAGIVDALAEVADRYPGENRFFHEVRAFAGRQIDRKAKKKPLSWQKWFLTTPIGRYVAATQALKGLDKATKGKYPAPYKAFESIMFATSAAGKNTEKAMDVETDGFAQLCVSPVAKSLMSLFFLTDECKKLEGKPGFKPEDAKKVTTVGVIGAGVMGSGIAQHSAAKKLNVYMRDVSEDAVAKGLAFVKKEFETDKKKKKQSQQQFEENVNRVTAGTDAKGLKEAQVIIEAAVERMDIKKKMVQELEAAGVLDGTQVFATNTSSLSVTELATASKYPQMVVGMHFFNPVAKMPLVEVIRGKDTSPAAVATVYQLAVQMGKFPIVVGDGPGFLVNRVLGLFGAEAGRILDEGADLAKVDKLLIDFGLPMGAYRLLDEVGLDVAAHVGPILTKGLGERFQAKAQIDEMVRKGWLGKKTKKGFYTYDDKEKQQGVNAEITTVFPATKADYDYADVLDRCVLLMVNEATVILEEGLVDSAGAVDTGMVFGTGFAPFRGGLLSYADHRGVGNIVQRLEELKGKYGNRFQPSATLSKMATDKIRFFPQRPNVPWVEPTRPNVKYSLW
eukprot:TRINITY_DN4539_c0_g1_i1.p1 TRINITY_DN4539_c0_g1~~TRINITY_DN4539_c0_g1_i1.p1  ORF type:complete len:815 (+),score=216.93 TRINITY_DN4539_c0_g1_i1:102-2447(+)